jgi:membrane-associated protein
MELIQQGLELLRNLKPWLMDLADNNLTWFYGLLFLIIFAETGLVVTPFLPGDSLLFIVGVIAAMPGTAVSLPLLLTLLIAAAILGDAVNYSIGARLGPAVFQYEGSWLFNKAYLLKAQQFYETYGAKTIILARFIPIVRTFAPFVAGIGQMNYGKFAFYNVVGAFAWVLICTMAGYFFGGIEWVEKHFEIVVLAIVFISVLPMVLEFLMELWRKKEETVAGAEAAQKAA